MKKGKESDPQSIVLETDLYFVGGVHSSLTETELTTYFTQFAAVDAITLRPSKNPASKGFAFIRLATPCNVISMVGDNPVIGGHTLSIEPAHDPKQKLESLQSRAMRKVFVGAVPQRMSSEQVLAAVQSVGPVERLTRFRVKSDRTKYCYAIMQSLDHALKLKNMKRIRVKDPEGGDNQVLLSLGTFIPKSKQPLQFLQSKLTSDSPVQKTKDKRKPHESLRFSPDKIHSSESSEENPVIKNTSGSDTKLDLYPKLPERAQIAVSNQTQQAPSPFKYRQTVESGISHLGRGQGPSTIQIRLHKNLQLAVNHRHEATNVRFNILLG